ncbi:hypothetical protein [Spiroplasma endosymbiont of Poecilobothrus nobilitatus]|uniref:hypothetical protein n=1 Tax=Spiroplasma endosymbiont of Poecilobothrus nobilitatus TaxID=1209220 RepID=UPI00313B4775
MSDKLQNINLPLPPLVKGVNITFADLYTFIGLLPLPEKEIMEIDLTKINEPNFIEKFFNFVENSWWNKKNHQYDNFKRKLYKLLILLFNFFIR